jgi:hypothetical protein
MGRWLDAAKSQTRKIVTDLHELHPDVRLEVGAVFYRDIGDAERFVVIPFTTDVDYVVERMRPVMPRGGDDTCEDVAGGFAQMHLLNWGDLRNTIRHLFFITDAPAHGRRWHTISVDDRFPDFGEELDALVRETEDRDIALTFIKFTDIVIPMIERMERIYAEQGDHITVVNLEPQTPPHRGFADTPPPLMRRAGFLPLAGGVSPMLRPMDTPEAILLTRTVSRMVSDSIQSHTPADFGDPLDL